MTIVRLRYGIGCGITDRWEPQLQVRYDEFLDGLGAEPPGPSCSIVTTYIGPVTDSQGNVFSQAFFQTGIQCDQAVNGVTFTLPGLTIQRCEDSAGHTCQIGTTQTPGDTARFPYEVPADQNGSYQVTTDPPVERGTSVRITIDSDEGDLRVDKVL